MISVKTDRTDYFEGLWRGQCATTDWKIKDQVAVIYLTELVGLTAEEASKFFSNDGTLQYRVEVFIAKEIHTKDCRPFWKKVSDLFPGVYSEEDIDYLTQNGIEAVNYFYDELEPVGGGNSLYMNRLGTAMHVSKYVP